LGTSTGVVFETYSYAFWHEQLHFLRQKSREVLQTGAHNDSGIAACQRLRLTHGGWAKRLPYLSLARGMFDVSVKARPSRRAVQQILIHSGRCCWIGCMCRSNRVIKKLGRLAVLLQCCECDAILTSSTPSQSFNKHFSCDVPSILSCNRAREGQLTAADVAPAREAAKAFAM
jgi:hypothetical protein